jgi:hypothetical protein
LRRFAAESEFRKRENGLLGADIVADQTKRFNTEVSPKISLLGSNHRRRVAPLALLPIESM